MDERREPQGEPPPPDEPDNPSSDELDIEGPNESAPGHAPAGEGDRRSEDPSEPTGG